MKQTLLAVISLLFSLFCSAQELPSGEILSKQAPERYLAEFRTTRGSFILEVDRSWSPLAADRLYQLILTGFYDGNSIFRVQKDYVVQFGICDKPEVNAFWEKRPIKDEPVTQKNLKGVVSYARDGKESRTTQIFINKKDNPKLDTITYNGLAGFPPVGIITEGFETVEAFYGGYGFEPANYQDSVMARGNGWLKAKFPELDFIITARIIE